MIILVCVFGFITAAFAAPSDRIVGGWEAQRGQFPYQVSAQYCTSTQCSHSCGGSILSDQWILTAAHCITEQSGTGSYYIAVGILNLNDTNPERQDIRVVESVVHPDFGGGVGPHDLGLWRLEYPLVFNHYIQPIPIPYPGEDVSSQEVVLSGWGSTGTIIIFPIMPNTLQTVTMPLVPPQECDLALTTVLGGSTHPLDIDFNICTGPLTGGVSACNGDSGGPLVQDGKLIGIVSWGITPCGTVGAPSVYVKVSYYINWIEEYITDPLRSNSNKLE